ncbi:MAG: hypothetical protein ACYCU0_08700 [Solirubrobacteraceae bacterium]
MIAAAKMIAAAIQDYAWRASDERLPPSADALGNGILHLPGA